MISVDNVTGHYEELSDIRGLTLDVAKGECLGLLGKSGSGKTTLLHMIAGCVLPSSGSIHISDYDLLKFPHDAKRQIGYMPSGNPLYHELNVREHLYFIAKLKHTHGPKCAAKTIAEWLEIDNIMNKLISELDRLSLLKVGLASALVANPPIFLLDDPKSGLNSRDSMEFNKLIERAVVGRTAIIATHVLHEATDLCSRTVIINRGRLASRDTLASLAASAARKHKLRLRINATPDEARRLFALVPGIFDVQNQPRTESGILDYIVEAEEDIRIKIWESSCKLNIPIIEIRHTDITLEDVYLQLTGESQDRERTS